ncbi:MAG TPA: iron-containing alcohol dehydrogenase [Thermodesulfobacteriota bacterium]|nr:iron-containing alcohol dehydrogenase [Thermodesulfobacteriota bacterium]
MKYPDLNFEPFFAWVNRPRIMYKAGLREELGFEMEKLGGKKVVLYTDKGLVQAGVAEMVIEAIKASNLKLVGVYDKIVQDARLDLINEGAAFYRKCGADCMVVVGGGSVMDTSKAINILIGGGLDDFSPLAEQVGLFEGAKPLPPHVAFPTTAGTGAEVTFAMVVLNDVDKVKVSCAHPFCNADIAMLDPELTVKLPPKITAFTGMDAMTHAIEAITTSSANPISDGLGLHAIRIITKYLPKVMKNPEDVEARGYLLIASTMAGMSFINAFTGGVHATAHALGALYGIPHGLANSIMLPHLMAFNLEENPARFVMIADAMGMNIDGLLPKEAAMAAVRAVKDLQKTLGLTQTLKDFGVPEGRDALQPLIDLAMGDSQVPYNPRYLEEDDVYNLFLKAR